ncbi:MAG: AbrB family transcriptional regulator [Thermoprotei archaeon]|nr:MAG: AbrB family transcriptional regulator [Thermoprotei archaeon]
MCARVRVDSKGRVVLPKKFRDTLGIKEREELILILRNNRIIVEKVENPFRVLEEVLGDLTFRRELRKTAEEEALKEVKRD